MRQRTLWIGPFVVLWGLLVGPHATAAVEPPMVRVRFQRVAADGEATPHTIDGRILVQAADGGLLVESQSGELWPIKAPQSPEVQPLEVPFSRLSGDTLKAALLAEFGPGFEVVQTDHYTICTNAGTGYGEWCGQMFERLYGGFWRFWEDRVPGLTPPTEPLVAIAFANAEEFQKYQLVDAGGAVSPLGYYSARTNRMVLFDHSAAAGRAASVEDARKRGLKQLNSIATVVHEAAHQLAFNGGLQTRYADNPIWLSEGLAMYFETPDLEGRTGWRTIGQINPARLESFRRIEKARPIEIRTLIASDDRFRDPTSAGDAYSEAWALHFYLLRTQREKYAAYIQAIGQKPRLQWDTPEKRVADFEAAFGPMEDVSAVLKKFMARLRAGR